MGIRDQLTEGEREAAAGMARAMLAAAIANAPVDDDGAVVLAAFATAIKSLDRARPGFAEALTVLIAP